jgi:hypothetical protein
VPYRGAKLMRRGVGCVCRDAQVARDRPQTGASRLVSVRPAARPPVGSVTNQRLCRLLDYRQLAGLR